MAFQYTIPDGMNAFERALKRCGDIVVSFLAMIAFSPVMLWCWWAVRHEDGGCAIFSQERIGRHGRPFRIYKFRSMNPNVEASGIPQLYDQDGDLRLTRVGKFIRQHHLDELPQLWNVFVGDMSLVGHRPERKYFIDQIMAIDSRYSELYRLQPGVTSYATIYNGYTDTIDKMLVRLDYDLRYLKERTILMDIRILCLTFWRIIKGDKF